ncbi:MAG: MEDS domain-containing protein [Streptosporangiaceae bacterium]
MSAKATCRPAGQAEHIAGFYGSEGELAGGASSYLAGGLDAGAIAFLIATTAHRGPVQTRMGAACDVAAARRRADFVVLDAAEMLRLFLISDHPDPDGFQLIIGGLIGRAARAARPVCLYSEMVALLWDAGHVTAAVALEELWNQLGQRMHFALLCGYQARAVSAGEHAAALQQVRGLHTASAGVPPARPAL